MQDGRPLGPIVALVSCCAGSVTAQHPDCLFPTVDRRLTVGIGPSAIHVQWLPAPSECRYRTTLQSTTRAYSDPRRYSRRHGLGSSTGLTGGPSVASFILDEAFDDPDTRDSVDARIPPERVGSGTLQQNRTNRIGSLQIELVKGMIWIAYGCFLDLTNKPSPGIDRIRIVFVLRLAAGSNSTSTTRSGACDALAVPLRRVLAEGTVAFDTGRGTRANDVKYLAWLAELIGTSSAVSVVSSPGD